MKLWRGLPLTISADNKKLEVQWKGGKLRLTTYTERKVKVFFLVVRVYTDMYIKKRIKSCFC